MRLRRRRKCENLGRPSRLTSNGRGLCRGSYFNQKEWLEELDETGPKKGEDKAPTGACRTKLLDNGRGSETSTARESTCDM